MRNPRSKFAKQHFQALTIEDSKLTFRVIFGIASVLLLGTVLDLPTVLIEKTLFG